MTRAFFVQKLRKMRAWSHIGFTDDCVNNLFKAIAALLQEQTA